MVGNGSEIYGAPRLRNLSAGAVLQTLLGGNQRRRNVLMCLLPPRLQATVKSDIQVLPARSPGQAIRRAGLERVCSFSIGRSFSLAERSRVRRTLALLPRDQRIAIKTCYGALVKTKAGRTVDADFCRFALGCLRHPEFPWFIRAMAKNYEVLGLTRVRRYGRQAKK
jgi:hypothetical protein